MCDAQPPRFCVRHAVLAEQRDERRRLAAGVSIPFTVNTIENELIDIQTQSLQARTNLEAARAQYLSVTGGLLKRYNVRLDR